MFIAYYDESGDDGFPGSSPLFVLSAVYLHYLDWQNVYKEIIEFRQELKQNYGLPIKLEIHAKHLLLGKNPYRTLNLSESDRVSIIDLFCEKIAQLNLKVINVVINKNKLKSPSPNYDVLDNALRYSIQRIENDLKKIDPKRKFIIITDEGRVGKMCSISRKIQRINFIPSKYEKRLYRQEIQSLIEDPLPKSSRESYFIQLSDLIAYIVYAHKLTELGIGSFPSRIPKAVNEEKLCEWLDTLKPRLNLEASKTDPYGIVCYPK